MTESTSPDPGVELIWRCESCGAWEPRYERQVNAKPRCSYCCTRCAPGLCTQYEHRREKDQEPRRRPLPIYMTAAVRRERESDV